MIRIISLSFILLFFFNNHTLSQDKIVFIDINFVFTNSIAGKDLNLQIEKKNNELNEKINNFKKDINTKKKKLISQKNVLSPEEYSKKIKELEINIEIINSTISKNNQELSIFKKTIEKEFSKKLNIIIEEYSVKNSISIILKKQDLLMAKNDLDITKEILKIFNDKIKKINIT
jgi:outer membrane protein